MIKMLTAYTEEIDEVEEGVAEIMGQINLGALKKNRFHNFTFVACIF